MAASGTADMCFVRFVCVLCVCLSISVPMVSQIQCELLRAYKQLIVDIAFHAGFMPERSPFLEQKRATSHVAFHARLKSGHDVGMTC